MKAIQFLKEFAVVELNTPEPGGRDLLVEIEAISVNPVDYKRRKATEEEGSYPAILGWDAAGTVVSTGSEVENFTAGDRVYYAGDLTRDGSNATHQLVDERIVGRCPKTLSFAEAAAMPLTGLTAWEALFTRLGTIVVIPPLRPLQPPSTRLLSWQAVWPLSPHRPHRL